MEGLQMHVWWNFSRWCFPSTYDKAQNFIVTSDRTQDNTQAVYEVRSLRWKVKQFHLETKQTMYFIIYNISPYYLRQQLKFLASEMAFS